MIYGKISFRREKFESLSEVNCIDIRGYNDNTMITKSPKTTRTQWKIRIFPHESHEKSPFEHSNTPV